MVQMVFCYHCRIHHPIDQVRRIETRKGFRWRCIRTLEAAHSSQVEREAFGRCQSEANRQESRRQQARQSQFRREQRYYFP